ncbi:hypothetical protein CVD28_19760 [Bacillus sp. M6-12]|nr:hypothetical protein CVD28_19760 [Bacillus sp. M6-12]
MFVNNGRDSFHNNLKSMNIILKIKKAVNALAFLTPSSDCRKRENKKPCLTATITYIRDID